MSELEANDSEVRGYAVAGIVAYGLISLLLLFLCVRLLFGRTGMGHDNGRPAEIADFLPIHHRAFEEVEQRLSQYDALLRRIHSERRELALDYLDSLRDDFLRVEFLLNCAAKFLPDLTLLDEGKRLWAGLRFRLQYRSVRLQMRFGVVPGPQISALTSQIRVLAHRADAVLGSVAQGCGLPALQSDVNK